MLFVELELRLCARRSSSVCDALGELISQDVVREGLLFRRRPRVGVYIEKQHHIPLHVACYSEVVGDLLEQHVGCFVVAGFKRFNSVLLRLVSN